METNEKDKWIDEVMDSLEDMGRAHVKEAVYQKIKGRLTLKTNGPRIIPLQKVSWVAACILLLVLLNVFSLLKKQSRYTPHNTMQSVVEYYQLNNSNSMYGL